MNEILNFGENLIPLIKELRHTTENDRRIAAPIVEEIRNSDLCQQGQPSVDQAALPSRPVAQLVHP